MERITLCQWRAPGKRCVRYCLRDESGNGAGSKIILYHNTGIMASRDDVVNNRHVKRALQEHVLAMCKAYTLMQMRRVELTPRNFEQTIGHLLDPGLVFNPRADEPLYERLVQYIEESYRDGVMRQARHCQTLSVARKFRRFLIIRGLSGLQPREFTAQMLMEYRQFVADEYLYAVQYPHLYPTGIGHRMPKKRCGNNTVVHNLKVLRAFFSELENADEIDRSPFRRLSGEKRRRIMHVMYDDPFFLRAEELRQVQSTSVPIELHWVKDLFVLNCMLGCRIGDLLHLTMDRVALSTDGIYYIHYIPAKTAGRQNTNREIQTPLIAPALEIVQRTRLCFVHGSVAYTKQLYNQSLRKLLRLCGIDRCVSIFNRELGDNTYLPLCDVASSKLARKTHVDIMNKVQINYYAAGLHREGSEAVFRYTSLELADRYELMKLAFGEE